MLAMSFVADPAFHVRQSSQYLEAFCDLAICLTPPGSSVGRENWIG